MQSLPSVAGLLEAALKTLTLPLARGMCSKNLAKFCTQAAGSIDRQALGDCQFWFGWFWTQARRNPLETSYKKALAIAVDIAKTKCGRSDHWWQPTGIIGWMTEANGMVEMERRSSVCLPQELRRPSSDDWKWGFNAGENLAMNPGMTVEGTAMNAWLTDHVKERAKHLTCPKKI
jgi:hypothetical protein